MKNEVNRALVAKNTKFLALATCALLLLAAGCKKNDEPQQPLTPVTLQCAPPAYLKPGDKVALISPSYFTPMENVTKTADVLRSWGLEPVIGPNVGKDIILFIEEVEESMHNIDQQLNILMLNGVLDRCKGVILGEFTDCGTEFTYPNVEAMLRPYFQKYNIPVLCGFPAGHGDINLPLSAWCLPASDKTN